MPQRKSIGPFQHILQCFVNTFTKLRNDDLVVNNGKVAKKYDMGYINILTKLDGYGMKKH